MIHLLTYDTGFPTPLAGFTDRSDNRELISVAQKSLEVRERAAIWRVVVFTANLCKVGDMLDTPLAIFEQLQPHAHNCDFNDFCAQTFSCPRQVVGL